MLASINRIRKTKKMQKPTKPIYWVAPSIPSRGAEQSPPPTRFQGMAVRAALSGAPSHTRSGMDMGREGWLERGRVGRERCGWGRGREGSEEKTLPAVFIFGVIYRAESSWSGLDFLILTNKHL